MPFYQVCFKYFLVLKKIILPLQSQRGHAQMAELVDALVSNTSEAIRAGSTPALGTRKAE